MELIHFVIISVLISVGDVSTFNADYGRYLRKYSKSHPTAEMPLREAIFKRSRASVETHNRIYAKGLVTYDQETNFFSDLTEAEIAAFFSSYPNRSNLPAAVSLEGTERVSIPVTLNLTTSKCMPAIKNQGSCGSCWAFAATNPIEYQYCVQNGTLTLLSEQQLVSCSDSYGNMGCNGGWYDWAWNYIRASGGIYASTIYPYTSSNGFVNGCKSLKSRPVVSLSNWTEVINNEVAMATAVATVGPVAIALYANKNFVNYKSGVFRDPTCPTNSINHAVTLVGYGNLKVGGAYWIVRNQWGPNWGMNGYILMARGVNQCNLVNYPAYPTIKLL